MESVNTATILVIRQGNAVHRLDPVLPCRRSRTIREEMRRAACVAIYKTGSFPGNRFSGSIIVVVLPGT
jgi:hypothetical protein